MTNKVMSLILSAAVLFCAVSTASAITDAEVEAKKKQLMEGTEWSVK